MKFRPKRIDYATRTIELDRQNISHHLVVSNIGVYDKQSTHENILHGERYSDINAEIKSKPNSKTSSTFPFFVHPKSCQERVIHKSHVVAAFNKCIHRHDLEKKMHFIRENKGLFSQRRKSSDDNEKNRMLRKNIDDCANSRRSKVIFKTRNVSTLRLLSQVGGKHKNKYKTYNDQGVHKAKISTHEDHIKTITNVVPYSRSLCKKKNRLSFNLDKSVWKNHGALDLVLKTALIIEEIGSKCDRMSKGTDDAYPLICCNSSHPLDVETHQLDIFFERIIWSLIDARKNQDNSYSHIHCSFRKWLGDRKLKWRKQLAIRKFGRLMKRRNRIRMNLLLGGSKKTHFSCLNNNQSNMLKQEMVISNQPLRLEARHQGKYSNATSKTHDTSQDKMFGSFIMTKQTCLKDMLKRKVNFPINHCLSNIFVNHMQSWNGDNGHLDQTKMRKSLYHKVSTSQLSTRKLELCIINSLSTKDNTENSRCPPKIFPSILGHIQYNFSFSHENPKIIRDLTKTLKRPMPFKLNVTPITFRSLGQILGCGRKCNGMLIISSLRKKFLNNELCNEVIDTVNQECSYQPKKSKRKMTHMLISAIRKFVLDPDYHLSKLIIQQVRYPMKSWQGVDGKKWSKIDKLIEISEYKVPFKTQEAVKIVKKYRHDANSRATVEAVKTFLLTGCKVSRNTKKRYNYKGFLSNEKVSIETFKTRYLCMLTIQRMIYKHGNNFQNMGKVLDFISLRVGAIVQKGQENGKNTSNRQVKSGNSLMLVTLLQNKKHDSASNENHYADTKISPTYRFKLKRCLNINSIAALILKKNPIQINNQPKQKDSSMYKLDVCDNIISSSNFTPIVTSDSAVSIRSEFLHLLKKASDLKDTKKSDRNDATYTQTESVSDLVKSSFKRYTDYRTSEKCEKKADILAPTENENMNILGEQLIRFERSKIDPDRKKRNRKKKVKVKRHKRERMTKSEKTRDNERKKVKRDISEICKKNKVKETNTDMSRSELEYEFMSELHQGICEPSSFANKLLQYGENGTRHDEEGDDGKYSDGKQTKNELNTKLEETIFHERGKKSNLTLNNYSDIYMNEYSIAAQRDISSKQNSLAEFDTRSIDEDGILVSASSFHSDLTSPFVQNSGIDPDSKEINPQTKGGINECSADHFAKQMDTKKIDRESSDLIKSHAFIMLCSENFLQKESEAIAKLASGRWKSPRLQTENITSERLFRNKFLVCDCLLIDDSGVDIELPGQIGIVTLRLSSCVTTKYNQTQDSLSETKEVVRNMVHLASVGRYKLIHLLLIADVVVDGSISSIISLLQNSLIKQKSFHSQQFSFEICSPSDLAESIAEICLECDVDKVFRHQWIEQYALCCQTQTKARFISSVTPSLTVITTLSLLYSLDNISTTSKKNSWELFCDINSYENGLRLLEWSKPYQNEYLSEPYLYRIVKSLNQNLMEI